MSIQESDNLDQHPVAESSRLSESIPVIDIGALRSGSSDPAATIVVQHIAQACRDWGFFQVVNHGVSAELIDDAGRQARQFFALPQSQKDAIVRTRENPWGYNNNELTKNQRDKKEVFDYTSEGVDPIYGSSNRWPETNDGFRVTMLAYLEACASLSLELLEAFCRVSPLPTVVNDSNPANYRSISWSEFRGRRTDGDYADYGPEVQISQFRTR